MQELHQPLRYHNDYSENVDQIQLVLFSNFGKKSHA